MVGWKMGGSGCGCGGGRGDAMIDAGVKSEEVVTDFCPGRMGDPFQKENRFIELRVGIPTLGAEPEIEVEGGGILNRVALV